MSALLAGCCAAVAVVLVAWPWRPPPARVRALGHHVDDAGSARRRRHRRAVPVWVAPVALGGVGAVLWWPLGVIGPVLWQVRRVRSARRANRRAARAAVACVPDTVDLAVVGATAGLTVPLVVRALSRRAPPPAGPAFANAVIAVEGGHRVADALEAVPVDAGEPLRPLVTALVASDRYGTPLVPSLERVAVEARQVRRREAEVAARRLPVLLLFPLVAYVLPSVALLTVVPLVVVAVGSIVR